MTACAAAYRVSVVRFDVLHYVYIMTLTHIKRNVCRSICNPSSCGRKHKLAISYLFMTQRHNVGLTCSQIRFHVVNRISKKRCVLLLIVVITACQY